MMTEYQETKLDRHWKIIVAVALVGLSCTIFTVHYFLFHDLHHIAIFFVGDIAFIPIEVLIVTLVIDQVLQSRERHQKMEKLTMVIGAFFSTLGIPLLKILARHDPHLSALKTTLRPDDSWSGKDFSRVRECMQTHECTVSVTGVCLQDLKDALVPGEDLLLRLLENPMILEHETFATLIQALFHLSEELKARPDVNSLPPADLMHLAGDIRRVYSLLSLEWIGYMEYQKGHYPYLFSLAMRRNPFDESSEVIIRK